MKINPGHLRSLHEKGVPLAEIIRTSRLPPQVVHQAILTSAAEAARPCGQRAVLTPSVVGGARNDVAAGRPVTEVAKRLRLPHSTVYSAVYGLSWRSVTDPAPLPRPAAARRSRRSAAEPSASVLTAADVAEARRLYTAPGAPSLRELALRFGVGETTIGSAIHGVNWPSVTEPPPVPIADLPGRRSLSDADLDLLRAMRAADATWDEIGARLGVHKSSAWRAYRRSTAELTTASAAPR